MSKFPLCQHVDILICSHGGVGTTFVSEFVAKYLKANDPYDSDHSKHIPLPPRRLPRAVKIIYIYGNPCEAAISLFARNYAHLQSCKNGVFDSVSYGESLEDYLQRGEDRLGLTAHLKRWSVRGNHRNSILLVKYDKLWDNVGSIVSFLGLGTECIDTFPVRIERNSSLVKFPPDQLARLKQIYKPYVELENSMTDVQIFNTK